MCQVKKRGAKTPNKKALEIINALNNGESLVLKKEQWLIVTPPGAHILRRHLKREFKVQTLIDNSGWKITALS